MVSGQWPVASALVVSPYLIPISILGDCSEGVTPVPIPNTEVKPLSPDGTARASGWESRTSPNYFRRPQGNLGPFALDDRVSRQDAKHEGSGRPARFGSRRADTRRQAARCGGGGPNPAAGTPFRRPPSCSRANDLARAGIGRRLQRRVRHLCSRQHFDRHSPTAPNLDVQLVAVE